ncbi:MAG: hypothetical protein IJ991_17035, partial [Thermoguttaceae bacterium]|nr:hypothetical protein [Thermoguttaceae bacterium]
AFGTSTSSLAGALKTGADERSDKSVKQLAKRSAIVVAPTISVASELSPRNVGDAFFGEALTLKGLGWVWVG